MADAHAKHAELHDHLLVPRDPHGRGDRGDLPALRQVGHHGTMLCRWPRAKAAMVALYFMHLRFETQTLGYIALTPLRDRHAPGAGAPARFAPRAAPDGRHEEARGAEALTRAARAGGGRAVSVTVLPTVNAVLNASAAVAMVLGFVAIRNRRFADAPRLHADGGRLLARSSSAPTSSITCRWARGPTRAGAGSGTLYFAILADAHGPGRRDPPAGVDARLYRALRTQFARHARLARLDVPDLALRVGARAWWCTGCSPRRCA